MAHKIAFELPYYELGKSDMVISIFEDTRRRADTLNPGTQKLGELHISKGRIDWYPKGVSKNKKTKTWRQFARLMGQ